MTAWSHGQPTQSEEIFSSWILKCELCIKCHISTFLLYLFLPFQVTLRSILETWRLSLFQTIHLSENRSCVASNLYRLWIMQQPFRIGTCESESRIQRQPPLWWMMQEWIYLWPKREWDAAPLLNIDGERGEKLLLKSRRLIIAAR